MKAAYFTQARELLYADPCNVAAAYLTPAREINSASSEKAFLFPGVPNRDFVKEGGGGGSGGGSSKSVRR